MERTSAKHAAAAPLETFKKTFKKVPGQSDFLPEEYRDYQHLIERLDSLATSFGFAKVEPPLYEIAETFKNFPAASTGLPLTHNINGSEVLVRNSALPGLLRMYVESHSPERERVSKWYYVVPVVTQQENPYQLTTSVEYGFEVLGEENPVFDAQILALAWKLYSELGNESVVLEVGSRGCENCWPQYREKLAKSLADAKYSLCKDCASSLEKNPERVFSCQQPDCQAIVAEAPSLIDNLDAVCSAHLTSVLESLDELGVPYLLSTGGDGEEHAKRTTFKYRFNHPQDSFLLSQGSRHDALLGHFGYPVQPALGLSGDFNKLLRAWRLAGVASPSARKFDVAFIPFGDLAAKKLLPVFSFFWDEHIPVVNLLGENSLKVRLQQAIDAKIPVALVMGQKEALEGTVILRDVRSGMQEVFPIERIMSEVQKRLV